MSVGTRRSGWSLRDALRAAVKNYSPGLLDATRRLRGIRDTGPPTKVSMIHHLSEVHGLRNYLEICTATTGLKFAGIDASRFEHCHRLMYLCPDDYEDGLEITHRSLHQDIEPCLRAVDASGIAYDVMLVDSYHHYDVTCRDLTAAFARLARGGVVVVHDCFPPTENMAAPEFKPGDWAGVSYHAFVDTMISRTDLAFYTVNCDAGCGVVRRIEDVARVPRHAAMLADAAGSARRAAAIRQWREIGHDYQKSYQFLAENARDLINLISINEFYKIENRENV
jgi:hypothetical protein